MAPRGFLTILLLAVSLWSNAKVELPDSMLTLTKAYKYFITSPDSSQAIIDVIRERGAEPAWRIDMAQGDLYYTKRRFIKAKSFYSKVKDAPVLRDSTGIQLLVLKRIMDCSDVLYDDNELAQTTLNLRKKAQACGNKAYEAMSLFTAGKWHHYRGLKEKGYRFCLDAVEMMDATDYPFKHIELRNFYTELLRMYARDSRYDEALLMSQYEESEAILPTPVAMDKYSERGLRQVYALRASVLARAGRMSEANKYYETWKGMMYGNAVDDMDIFDYLQSSQHEKEALGAISRYRVFLEESGDTLSYRMLSVLNKEALLYIEVGDYERAARYGQQVGHIAHNLYANSSAEQMQATYELMKEQADSQKKTLWLGLLTASLVIVVALALVILYYIRYIRRRNAQLLKVFNSLEAYRRAVINGESTTSPKVVAAIEELRSIKLPSDLSVEGVEEPDDEDRRLFVEMDTQVTRDRLFLKPGLGREDLMRLIGVDKNRFGKMMSKYSDASNTSVYINTKRVEYGARLLMEHPEYTIATVATECGMSNTVTFNRSFKEIYQMTPSEYREKFPTK